MICIWFGLRCDCLEGTSSRIYEIILENCFLGNKSFSITYLDQSGRFWVKERRFAVLKKKG